MKKKLSQASNFIVCAEIKKQQQQQQQQQQQRFRTLTQWLKKVEIAES